MFKPKHFKAEEIVNWSEEQIWEMFNDEPLVTVEYADKTTESLGRGVVYSWYYWQFHRKYGNAVYSWQSISNDNYNKGTHGKLLSKCLWGAWDHLVDTGVSKDYNIFDLAEEGWDLGSTLYNLGQHELGDYVITVCILDYIEIHDDPVISAAVKRAKEIKTLAAIEQCYVEVEDRLRDPTFATENQLKRECIYELLSWGQILQSMAPRGYGMDIDGVIMPEPIMNSFLEGIGKLQDHLLESRAASLSTMSNEDPIKEVEYFGRRIQLMANYVTHAEPGDCGSREYITVNVKKGTERRHLGAFYLNAAGFEFPIREETLPDIVGKTVQMRSPLTCKHRHMNHVCHRCYGELISNFDPTTNLGHIAATTLSEGITQRVLSTKHLIKNAVKQMFRTNKMMEKYFQYDMADDCLRIHNHMLTKGLRMSVARKDMIHMDDVLASNDPSPIPARTVTKIRHISFYNVANDDYVPDTFSVALGTTAVHLSTEMLHYIKNNGYTLNDKGDFIINMDNWKFNRPLISLPVKFENTLDYKKAVAKYLESTGDKSGASKGEQLRLCDMTDHGEALEKFIDVTEGGGFVNAAHLQILMLAMLGHKRPKGLLIDANIPKLGDEWAYMTRKTCLERKSGAITMAFEKQRNWTYNAEHYMDSRPDSYFDGLVTR